MIRPKIFLLALAAVLGLSVALTAEQNVLYEKDSPYNHIVVIDDGRGLRTLQFERFGARQSVVKVGDPDHLELPYAKAMPLGLAFAGAPRRVLIVGLGGGTIPSFLHKHYPRTMIDVVDIDPDVVDVAKRFFGFREDATLRAHVADGRRFIEQCREPYDVIFLDAFGSENVPYHLATREFLEAVRRALAPGGVAVGNIWSRGSNPLYDSMVRTYQEVFDEVSIIDVRGAGNRIVIALPRTERIEPDELARRARAVSTKRGFPYDMGEVALYGYRGPEPMNAEGRVLRDDEKPSPPEP